MARMKIFLGALLALALTVSPQVVRADDPCMASDEERNTKAVIARAANAEKSGQPAELFLAYHAVVFNDCVPDQVRAKARASLPKLGRELAKAAEAKGLLYGKEPIGTGGKTSAFAWLEAAGDFAEANRVMLKVVQAKPEEMALFDAAWRIDEGRYELPTKIGERKAFISPPAYRQALQKVASANADKLMKAEEKDAAGLTGNAAAVGAATMNSMEKLIKASAWMKFLPDGDKPAKARAEQRGDAIMKRSDPTFTQANALRYYEFAGSAKAKAAAKQVEAKQEAFGRAAEKSAEKVKGSITQKSEAEQKKFDKGKANLEKELGF